MPRAGLDSGAVVQAAAALVDAEGLASLSLARLASALGIRAPSLYAHVGGLEDLRRRLASRGTAELTAALQAAAAGRSGADALSAVAGAYRAYAHGHPGTYAALQHPPDPADDAQITLATALVEIVLAVLRGYGLRGEDAFHGARTIRAALHGFVSLEAEGGFGLPLDLDESFTRLIETLDAGLRDSALP